MINNSEHIDMLTNGLLASIAADLSTRFKNAIDTEGITEYEIGEILDIHPSIVNEVTKGDLSNVSAEELLKMFVAQGLMIDIQEISMPTQPQSVAAQQRQDGVGNQRPSTGARRIPVYDEAPVPPHGNERIMFEQENPHPQVNENHRVERPFDLNDDNEVVNDQFTNKTETELDNIIISNIWDSEINLDSASVEDKRNFVRNKQKIMDERNNRNSFARQRMAANSRHENRRENFNNRFSNPRERMVCNDAINNIANVIRDAINDNPSLLNRVASEFSFV